MGSMIFGQLAVLWFFRKVKYLSFERTFLYSILKKCIFIIIIIFKNTKKILLELRDFAAEYRLKNLDSEDEKDKTFGIWDKKWSDVERRSENAEALGGPYIGVHLRRKDFLYARKEELPSLEGAAREIKNKMEEYGVDKVFIGTDGVEGERETMKKLLGADKVS